jgi:hypothetical protein
VKVNFAAGKAEMHLHDLPMDDYFNLPNALADGPEVDVTVSFDVAWGGPVTRRLNIQDGSNGNRFAGEFVETQATVTWSGSNELGFSFTANPGDFSTSVAGRAFAELGHERNGTFVPADPPAGNEGRPDTNGGFEQVLAALAVRPISGAPAMDGAGGAGVRTYPGMLQPAVWDWSAPTSARQTAQTPASPDDPIAQTGRPETLTDALDRSFAGLANGQDDLLLKF